MRWREMDGARRVALVTYFAVVVVLAVIIANHLLSDRRRVSWASFALPASYFLWLAFELLYRRWKSNRHGEPQWRGVGLEAHVAANEASVALEGGEVASSRGAWQRELTRTQLALEPISLLNDGT